MSHKHITECSDNSLHIYIMSRNKWNNCTWWRLAGVRSVDAAVKWFLCISPLQLRVSQINLCLLKYPQWCQISTGGIIIWVWVKCFDRDGGPWDVTRLISAKAKEGRGQWAGPKVVYRRCEQLIHPVRLVANQHQISATSWQKLNKLGHALWPFLVWQNTNDTNSQWIRLVLVYMQMLRVTW